VGQKVDFEGYVETKRTGNSSFVKYVGTAKGVGYLEKKMHLLQREIGIESNSRQVKSCRQR
jgi:hypothetical protein